MKNVYKIFFCFSLALLLALIRLPAPAFAITSLNGCLQNAQCAADIGLAKAATATASPTMTLPFLPLSAGSLPMIAALAYIGHEGYQALQDKGIQNRTFIPQILFLPGVYSFIGYNCSVTPTGGTNSWGTPLYIGKIYFAPNFTPSNLTPDTRIPQCLSNPNASPIIPPISEAPLGLSDADVVAAAAIAAIAFANNPSNSDDAKMAAALAAVAAAGLLPSSTANDALKAAAAAAAAAATAAAAASQAQRDEQARDKAIADNRAAPANLPVKNFATSTNFVSYFLSAMASKFPLDIIFGATTSTAPLCPSYTFFYYRHEMCFLLPLFTTLRWITFIGLSTKAIMEL